MSTETADHEIHQFVKAYVKAKQGEMLGETGEVFTVTYPDLKQPLEYTYQPAVAREKNVALLTSGSPAFQQILKECLENGSPCQIQVKPKGDMEALVRRHFKDSPFDCERCHNISADGKTVSICTKPQACYHRINNGKIAAVNVAKTEPLRYFLFFFSATFQNKLRPKNKETITILMDEKGNVGNTKDFDPATLLQNKALQIQDHKTKLKPDLFETLKAAADHKLGDILKKKVALYDLPLSKEKKAKLKSFTKRLRRERREQVISKTHNFDYVKWQANFEALLKKEEEAYLTSVAVKFVNLLIVNTCKVKFEVHLNNKASLLGAFNLGINHACEVVCPLCHNAFTEGYATQDGFYVCPDCIRQSADTAKIYSKKASLSLDETLNEYLERDAGFVCSVCGKKHSRLLEFKCSHDNSSVCIYHYDLCDMCGKVFSKLNLTYTDEFQRKLCPKHAKAKET
ncbi:MAG: hypothetical protein M1540_00045 [Candidatus Bathyarchaeota archaeon]|nr:hypothetical protein [Candidatus Bathyarchaeota archaeon]